MKSSWKGQKVHELVHDLATLYNNYTHLPLPD